MTQRRLAWALGALIALVGVGCRGETTSQGEPSTWSSSIPAGEQAFEVNATRRANELVSRAMDRFRAPSFNTNSKKKLAKTSILTASPIERFTTDGVSILAVPLASHGREPVTIVRLPKLASDPMRVESAGVRIDVKPIGFASSPIEWGKRVAVYADVLEGTHAFRRVDAAGVEDFYQVETAKDELSFSYEVTMQGVAGLRLVSGSLALLDAGGTPRLHAPTPFVVDANGERRLGRIEVSGCAYDSDPSGPWGRPVRAPGSSTCVVSVKIDARGLSFPVLVDPAWRPTYNTTQTHAYHQMVAIPAGADVGKVLLLGGVGSAPQITELFDPGTNTWAASASLPETNGLGVGTAAAVFSDGTVILTGGFPASGTTSSAKATVLVRTPAGAWSYGGALSVRRAWHSLQVIKTGGKEYALAAGGQPTDSIDSSTKPYDTAELYDPSIAGGGAWKGTSGKMKSPHAKAGSSVMADGKVVIAGGDVYSSGVFGADSTKNVDIFDPATSAFTASTMTAAREAPVVVALKTAGAIIAGGYDQSTSLELDSVEYFDGSAATALTAKLSEPRAFAVGERLDDGRVLITGGQQTDPTSFTTTVSSTADLYDPGAAPKSGTITSTATMGSARRHHAMVRLAGKGILVTGGENADSLGSEVSVSELFDTTLGKTCLGAVDCPSGTYCTEGVCCQSSSCPEGQTCRAAGHEGVCTKPKGSTCAGDGECATGHCADGVCCESACNTECHSCNEAGSVGTCQQAKAGTDPKGMCSSSGGGDRVCGPFCDSTGSCGGYASAGAPCGGALSADGGLSDAGTFCKREQCDGTGFCSSSTYTCGLTCTSSVTCNEATKSCSASPTGVLAGYCVIDGQCWTYGDINPKDDAKCQICNPPVSKIKWFDSCAETGGVDAGDDTSTDDTGASFDSSVDDAGSDGSVVDTNVDEAPPPDTSLVDSTPPNPGAADLPSGSTCSCTTPGGESSSSSSISAALAVAAAAMITSRRRRRR